MIIYPDTVSWERSTIFFGESYKFLTKRTITHPTHCGLVFTGEPEMSDVVSEPSTAVFFYSSQTRTNPTKYLLDQSSQPSLSLWTFFENNPIFYPIGLESMKAGLFDFGQLTCCWSKLRIYEYWSHSRGTSSALQAHRGRSRFEFGRPPMTSLYWQLVKSLTVHAFIQIP